MHCGQAPRGELKEKSCGVGAGARGAVVRALEALGEAEPRDGLAVERRVDRIGEEDDRVAVALAERGGDGVGEPAARLVADDEPVDDDEQLLREGDVDVRDRELVEVHDDAVEADAHEALRAEVLDDDLVGDLVRELERGGDVEARARRAARAPCR